MLERVIDQAKKVAQQAEAFWVDSQSTPVGFEANRLKELQTRQSSGIALRIVKDGRIGFSSTTNMEDVQGLMRRAIEVSQFGAKARFTLPAQERYPAIDIFDSAVDSLSVEDMVGLGQDMIDRVRAHNKDLLCEAHVVKSTMTVELLNSSGGHARYRRSSCAAGVGGTLIRGTDMLFVGDDLSSCHPITDTSSIINTTVQQLEMARETVEAPSGTLPVLFTPRGMVHALLSPLLIGFNGKTVLQGASPLVGRLGHKVVSEAITVWDDPTMAHIPGSRPCDDEGTPSRRNRLIEHGVAKTFLYDLQTAGLAKTQSTGSASRSLSSLPSPSTSVIVIPPGTESFQDILSDIKEGLLVEDLLGAGQGNILSGDFSGNVLLGYKIQQGKIIGRVKDTMIAGNVYKALSDGVRLAKETRWVGGSVSTPAVCCAGVAVSRKG
ncbi:MAG: TldD/PmbA family protein [Chloroflexi bacterium]|nr:TldD/PmbA family protein [Chloroflexota bacterium]